MADSPMHADTAIYAYCHVKLLCDVTYMCQSNTIEEYHWYRDKHSGERQYTVNLFAVCFHMGVQASHRDRSKSASNRAERPVMPLVFLPLLFLRLASLLFVLCLEMFYNGIENTLPSLAALLVTRLASISNLSVPASLFQQPAESQRD